MDSMSRAFQGRIRRVVAAGVVLLWAGGAPARDDEPRTSRQENTTLDGAVQRVQRETHGRVLSADTYPEPEGREVHRIRVLTPEGRVRQYQVDPDSGELR